MNLRLIDYDDHRDGGLIAWTVVFTDRDRRMVTMIYAGALSQLAVYSVCKAFEVDQLTQRKLVGVEYPSGIVLALVRAAIITNPRKVAGRKLKIFLDRDSCEGLLKHITP